MLAQRITCFALSAALVGFGLTSCGEKEKPSSGGGDTPAEEVVKEVTEAAEEVVEAVIPKASVADRAAKLGFAKHLPKNTEGYLGIYDGAGLVAEFRASKLGTFIEKMAADEGVDLDDIEEDPQAGMVLSLFKEEFFVAVGEGTAKQSSKLLELQALSSFAQMKMVVEMAAAEMTGEGVGGMGFEEAYFGFLREPGAVKGLLEGAQMPPITIGFKVSDEEARMGLAQMIAGTFAEGVAMLGPDGEGVAEEVKVPAMDGELTGIRFLGDKVVAKMKEEGADKDMAEVFGAAQTTEILGELSDNNLVAVAGAVGDYVIIFAGTDAAEFVLAESPEESLVASSDMAFMDGYLDKKLVSVTTMSKALMASLGNNPGDLGNMAAGIKSGLRATEVFGDTQDIEVLLDLLGEQEEALRGMFKYLPAGVVAYRDQGYKIDGFGGSTRPDVDLTSQHKFGALSDWEDALFYASWIADKEYAEKSLEWLDTLGETAYLAAKKVAQMRDLDDPDFRQFQEGFGMFDEMFRDDALKLWKAVREDMNSGIGGEAVMLVDLKGGLPTVPGIPPTLLEKATAPRFAVVAPIDDREKLRGSWQNINGAMESILKKVSEMTGENIPMQKPMSSEKDELITWFFQIPFQTEDFLLSVSLDEDTFYATSSKTMVREIGAMVDAGGTKVTGEHARLDVATLRTYLGDLLTLVDENAEEVFGGEAQAQSFKNDLPEVRAVLDAFSEVQGLSWETQLKGGQPHTSIHLHIE